MKEITRSQICLQSCSTLLSIWSELLNRMDSKQPLHVWALDNGFSAYFVYNCTPSLTPQCTTSISIWLFFRFSSPSKKHFMPTNKSGHFIRVHRFPFFHLLGFVNFSFCMLDGFPLSCLRTSSSGGTATQTKRLFCWQIAFMNLSAKANMCENPSTK